MDRVSSADNDLFWCQADVLETDESKDYPIKVIIAYVRCSNWCIPYQLKTLDQQVPQFKILSSDISCLDDQSCLIKWVIESDRGSPISRAEISYAKARGENAAEQWSPAIQIERTSTRYRLSINN